MTRPAVLTVKEVAKLLKCHPATVRRYALRGELPFIRMGARIMILRAPLEKMLAPAPP